MSVTHDFIHFFRDSSPYIQSHRGKCFVIALGGDAIKSADFASIIHDIALLSSLGVKLILVHGSRPQIDEQLALYGKTCRYEGNRRITTPDLLPCVLQACGALRLQIEALFSMGLPNSPMHGASVNVVSGNWVTARPLGVVHGIDFEHTGCIRKLDVEAISQVINGGSIALLSSVGFSLTGEIFNLSYEEVAREVAVSVRADKLIYFSLERGITDLNQQLVRELSPEKMNEVALSDENRLLVEHAFSSCQAGVQSCHLVSYQESGSLLAELYTREGAGTLISLTPYEGIRGATFVDVGGLLELIAPLERAGVLVKRSRERLEQEIEHFCVIERGGMIIGSAALYPFGMEKMAELACLVVHDEYRDQDRGKKLLGFIELRAKELGLSKLFVLTTHTAHWFIENGFVRGDIDAWPCEKKRLYNYQRGSQIFWKKLV